MIYQISLSMTKHLKIALLLPTIAIVSMLVTAFVAVTIQLEQKALAQSSSSNPVTKVPVIGNLMNSSSGGTNNTTNNTPTNQSSNPLAKVPVIGKLFGSKYKIGHSHFL